MKHEPSVPRSVPAVRSSPFSVRVGTPFILAIRLYQALLGPLLGGQCRFHPTCSHYAIEAYRIHNPLRATWLVARRLARCQPLCKGGFDPVPEPARGSP